MADKWTPPTRRQDDGAIAFGDWRPVRDAIEAAQRALGKTPTDDIPTDVWNLVGLAMDYHAFSSAPHCVECEKHLFRRTVIRCFDCKAPLCETCAPRHFWPNGRPTSEVPRVG